VTAASVFVQYGLTVIWALAASRTPCAGHDTAKTELVVEVEVLSADSWLLCKGKCCVRGLTVCSAVNQAQH
jgi:hypothetical protein